MASEAAVENSQRAYVIVTDITGKEHRIALSVDSKVGELKQKICQTPELGVPCVAQKLLVGDVLLESDSQCLRDVEPSLLRTSGEFPAPSSSAVSAAADIRSFHAHLEDCWIDEMEQLGGRMLDPDGPGHPYRRQGSLDQWLHFAFEAMADEERAGKKGSSRLSEVMQRRFGGPLVARPCCLRHASFEFRKKSRVSEAGTSSAGYPAESFEPSRILEEPPAEPHEKSEGPCVTLIKVCSVEQAVWLARLEQKFAICHAEDFLRHRMPLLRFFATLPECSPEVLEESRMNIQVYSREFHSVLNLPDEVLQDERFIWLVLKMTTTNFLTFRPFFLCCVRAQVRQSEDLAKMAADLEPTFVALLEPQLLTLALMQEIVEKHPGLLAYAGQDCKSDRSIVLKAVSCSGSALQFAVGTLQDDTDVVNAAVQQNGRALRFASTRLREDRSVVTVALQQAGRALEHACTEFKSDREMVLLAVQQDGTALEFAAAALQGDWGVVTAAVQQCPAALKHATEEMRTDKSIAAEAVSRDGDALEWTLWLRGDWETVYLAVQQNGEALRFASSELRASCELVLKAIEHSAGAYEHASPELQSEDLVLLKAAQRAFPWHSDDPFDAEHSYHAIADIIKRGGFQNFRGKTVLKDAMLTRKAFALAAVQKEPKTYLLLDDSMRSDREVALAAVKHDWTLFQDVPWRARACRDIQIAALRKKPDLLWLCVPSDRSALVAALQREREAATAAPPAETTER
eukprot:TRINITY_DN4573_c0_g1_i2.p1 TRINITY_DN4573_c0_g1~~TRINITY_DN4573_c0_g1_i2.p1  ORF type:complete len:743 (-),score=157.99 TRINITY_DN4573_c0_g1_i2:23-2251(-)